MRKRLGFTLMEFMIVVMIIGILIAISVPVFIEARANARYRVILSDLQSIDRAQSQWRMEQGKPAGACAASADLSPGYLTQLPVPPIGTQPYQWNGPGCQPTLQGRAYMDWYNTCQNHASDPACGL